MLPSPPFPCFALVLEHVKVTLPGDAWGHSDLLQLRDVGEVGGGGGRAGGLGGRSPPQNVWKIFENKRLGSLGHRGQQTEN